MTPPLRDRDPFRIITEQERSALSIVEMAKQAPTFDLRTASPEALKAFFLPPRPDPGREPDAHHLWMRVMEGPFVWPDLRERSPISLFQGTRLASHFWRGSQETSSNWSGAIARTFDRSSIWSVYGLWQVPEPNPPAGGVGPIFASSAWIGLDGHDPASRSMPQLGSGHWFDPANGAGPKIVFLWWEWFVRDSPINGYKKIEVPVQPRDWIYAQITKLTPTSASFCIINLTSPLKLIFPFYYDQAKSPVQPPVSATNPLTPTIEGRTAEWIMERPRRPSGLHEPLFPMTDYGALTFDGCIAGTDSSDPSRAALNLRYAKLQRMVGWGPPPPGSKALSTPEQAQETRFRIHYGA